MVVELGGRTTSLLDSWPEWESKLLQFSKAESATRPAMRKILEELEADHSDIAYPAGVPWKMIVIKSTLLLSSLLLLHIPPLIDSVTYIFTFVIDHLAIAWSSLVRFASFF